MRFFGYALVPQAEVIEGLRANVGKLERKMAKLKRYTHFVEGKLTRTKAQVASDQKYIDRLEALVDPVELAELKDAMRTVRGAQPAEQASTATKPEPSRVSPRTDGQQK